MIGNIKWNYISRLSKSNTIIAFMPSDRHRLWWMPTASIKYMNEYHCFLFCLLGIDVFFVMLLLLTNLPSVENVKRYLLTWKFFSIALYCYQHICMDISWLMCCLFIKFVLFSLLNYTNWFHSFYQKVFHLTQFINFSNDPKKKYSFFFHFEMKLIFIGLQIKHGLLGKW